MANDNQLLVGHSPIRIVFQALESPRILNSDIHLLAINIFYAILPCLSYSETIGNLGSDYRAIVVVAGTVSLVVTDAVLKCVGDLIIIVIVDNL
jgi:hypothetical protein